MVGCKLLRITHASKQQQKQQLPISHPREQGAKHPCSPQVGKGASSGGPPRSTHGGALSEPKAPNEPEQNAVVQQHQQLSMRPTNGMGPVQQHLCH